MKYLASLVLTLFVTGSIHCIFTREPAPTPTSTFNYMWSAINEKYALFGYKCLNWDSVKTKYQSMINDDMSDDRLFVVLSMMLDELKDGHANLQSSFNRSRSWDWFLDFPQNYNRTIQQRNYLGRDYMITGGIEHRMIDSVGYLYIPSFEKPITDKDVDYILNRYKNSSGLIIDIRNNGGGNAKNIFRLASRIVDEKIYVYSSWFKNGPGADDFGKEIKVSVEPSSRIHYKGTVIVLTNRACYSAANRFAAVFSLLPDVIIIGDKTGGGGGTPCFVELPNGWYVRFSAMKTLRADGYNIDEGINPDIPAEITPEDEAKGIDTIIERALLEIRNRRKQR
ncbi:MAG TPA: S41 family peptidase [Bacteroidales bacterium]|nr:S41 family peptidase [Bacteroidales bacterium]HPT10985.1 S41 family peptidase [Bacteroidales bacterium]